MKLAGALFKSKDGFGSRGVFVFPEAQGQDHGLNLHFDSYMSNDWPILGT
jgi:hypothetical protein